MGVVHVLNVKSPTGLWSTILKPEFGIMTVPILDKLTLTIFCQEAEAVEDILIGSD